MPSSRRYALYALGVIFAANFLSYLDRQLVSALEDPISTSLALKPKQFGLLWSLFTIGYMLSAPFIGYLADRGKRTRLFAICIVVWSLATMASGMAQTKGVLYVARVFIGVGEAGCLIIGSALISDFFQQESRGRALSIFYLGLPLGGTTAFIMAGALLDIGWRRMFYIAGVPGFLIALLIWVMVDPPRGSGESSGHGPARTSAKEYLGLFRIPSLLLVILAQAFAVIILVPLIHFGTKFFEDSRGLSEKEARITLGVIALVAGALGNTLSGFIGDRLSKRHKGVYASMAGISYLVGWPCLLIGFLSHNRWIFLPALTLGAFCIFLCMPAVNTQIANVTPPRRRAMAWAMAVFVLHLLGDTLTPPIFGQVLDVTDRQTAFVVFSTALLPAGICCLLAARTTARDMERAAAGS